MAAARICTRALRSALRPSSCFARPLGARTLALYATTAIVPVLRSRPEKSPKLRARVASTTTYAEAVDPFDEQVLGGVRLVPRIAQRAAFLAVAYGPLVLTSWVPYLANALSGEHALARFCRWLAGWWWRWLCFTVERSGPCFIKLAQWASSRPDLFSPTVAALFEPLVDSVPPDPWPRTARCLAEAFGPAWADELHVDSSNLLGSGCVAQVYRAQLNSSPGRPERQAVAVKVLRPAVRATVEADLALLRVVAAAVALLPGADVVDPVGVVRDFRACMRAQLDLRREAGYLETFRHNFASTPGVTFPAPVRPYVARDALVETLVEGEPVLNCTTSPQRKRLARLGIDAVLQMIFIDGFVHADLHPGNIIAVDEGAESGAGLAFVDAGLVTRVRPEAFATVVGVLGAMVHYDGKEAGRLLLRHSRQHLSAAEAEAFCEGVDRVVQHARRPDVNFFDHVGDHVRTIFALAWAHGVRLHPDFVSVAVRPILVPRPPAPRGPSSYGTVRLACSPCPGCGARRRGRGSPAGQRHLRGRALPATLREGAGPALDHTRGYSGLRELRPPRKGLRGPRSPRWLASYMHRYGPASTAVDLWGRRHARRMHVHACQLARKQPWH